MESAGDGQALPLVRPRSRSRWRSPSPSSPLPWSGSITMPEMMLASGSTASEMMRAASATSWSVRSAPPEMLISTPLAPWIEVSSSSGEEIARCAASSARCSPLAMPVPISAMPMPVMIVRTSAKSTLISPGTVIRSLMPCTAWRSTSSAMRKASDERGAALDEVEQPLVGDGDQGVDRAAQLVDAALGELHAPPPLEAERLGDHRHGERADLGRQRGDDRHRAGAGAAAQAGGQEDHVGALEDLEDALGVLERGLAAHLGVGAGAQALGEQVADLQLDRRAALAQRLEVGVGGDELDAAQLRVDHAVDRVAAAAAHPDHLDPRRDRVRRVLRREAACPVASRPVRRKGSC